MTEESRKALIGHRVAHGHAIQGRRKGHYDLLASSLDNEPRKFAIIFNNDLRQPRTRKLFEVVSHFNVQINGMWPINGKDKGGFLPSRETRAINQTEGPLVVVLHATHGKGIRYVVF